MASASGSAWPEASSTLDRCRWIPQIPWVRPILLGVAVFLLSGCPGQNALMKMMVPADDDAFALGFIQFVANGRYEEAVAMMEPSLRNKSRPELEKIHALFKTGKPQYVQLVIFAANNAVSHGKKVRQVELGYQFRFTEGWQLARIVTHSSADGRFVVAIQCNPLPATLQEINRFDVNNKKPVHQLFLGACVLVPMIIVVTILMCIGSRVRRRWLWILFILVGFGQFEINWSSGQWDFHPLSVLVLGAGLWRHGVYGSWILKFGIPVGAMVFLARMPWLWRPEEPPKLLQGDSASH